MQRCISKSPEGRFRARSCVETCVYTCGLAHDSSSYFNHRNKRYRSRSWQTENRHRLAV
ncbi:hypothetical protein CPT_Musica_049 [Burkholderia phage Musica]|uniref:Uncharacterized protein n=1 Tax=Burkholderia phage Musica TaxID=2924903 RepID=A0AAE9G6R5_9CAUD|nr:hypothetical protein CPT_Musica_049 [Burkholderia phage Musica]